MAAGVPPNHEGRYERREPDGVDGVPPNHEGIYERSDPKAELSASPIAATANLIAEPTLSGQVLISSIAAFTVSGILKFLETLSHHFSRPLKSSLSAIFRVNRS